MNIQIESPGFKVNNELVLEIYLQFEKLHREDRIISAHVLLRVEKDKQGENKVVEVRVNLPGQTLFASGRASHFEVALKEAVRALGYYRLKLSSLT